VFEVLLIRKREEQLVAVRIDDLDHVITPPRFLARNRALDNLAAKLRYAIMGRRYKQTCSVLASGILTENDFALCAIDLADFALAIVFVPGFLEAEQVHIEAKCPSSTQCIARKFLLGGPPYPIRPADFFANAGRIVHAFIAFGRLFRILELNHRPRVLTVESISHYLIMARNEECPASGS